LTVRVVFDTNVFISAFAIPGGNAEDAYLHAVHGAFELVTSVAILTETARVLQTKFDWSHEKVQELLQNIGRVATILRTEPTLRVLSDDPDNRILECAQAARADFIVTGDRHLLSLQRHGDSTVLTLTDFLARLREDKT
jgi:putative PIN family toxin of toxin-antitoxin system